MTTTAWWLVAGAGATALGDWVAVAARHKILEYVCKPATILLLVGAALSLHPHIEGRRWAFVVALAASALGDVFLMLPADRFVQGLASFFGAHIAYIVGLRIGERAFGPLAVSAAIVFVVATILGRRILTSVRESHPELGTPVSAYIAIISVMVACGLASGEPFAATGAVAFMASDTLIAWNRFVRPLDWAPVTIMVTYHLAQGLLTLSLAL